MLSRFSVKRPYTVFVGVVLVIILGIVSVTKMNTDLLPSMNMPYSVVMTTYVGASPEQVELVVTKAVEQAMATTSNIKNIRSVSSENMSLAILEFNSSANMDSVTIEMREKLDQIRTYWPDEVSNPIIMKLNPDMMPVMIAAASMEDKKPAEVTAFVESKVLPQLESLSGVASVSTTGGIKESIQVIIRDEKIKAMNQKVEQALADSFQEAESKIGEGKEKLEEGQKQLDSGKEKLLDQTTEAGKKLSESQLQMVQGETKIDTQLKEMESKKTELAEQKRILVRLKARLNTLKEGTEKLDQSREEKEKELKQLDQSIADLELQLDQMRSLKKEELETQLEQLKIRREQLVKQNQQIDTQFAFLEEQLAEQGLTREVLDKKIKELEEGISVIDQGLTQLKDAGKALEKAKKEMANGKTTVSEAMKELEKQKLAAAIEMGSSQAELNSGKSELDKAEKELKESKEDALKQSNLNEILTDDMVKNFLIAENFSMPAGYVTEDNIEYLIRVGDKTQNTKELKNLVILDLGVNGVEPIRLSDVADVITTDNSAEVYAKMNGNPAIMLTMQKQTEFSTGDVTDRIKKCFQELEAENENLIIIPFMDQGIYIDLVVQSVVQNALMGGVLAVLILLFFLKSIRPTLIIACSIPISIVTALVLMYFSGISLNVISLSGLALGVGMLVDNSIVVIENIARLKEEGYSAKRAAVEGAKQVSGAIAASTLTTICVFAPIIFTEGITKQLFVDMGLTIAFSLTASLAVALTLVPAMGGSFLTKNQRKKEQKENHPPLMERMINIYGVCLDQILYHKVWLILFVVISLVGSGFLVYSKGSSFMPEMDSTQMSVHLETDIGTSFKETVAIADKAVERINKMNGVADVGAMSSSGSLMSMMGGSQESDSNHVTMYLLLDKDGNWSSDKIREQILEQTKDLGGEFSVESSSMDMSSLGGSGITVQIKGKELDELQKISKDIAEIVQKTEGTQEVLYGSRDTAEELRVIVNKKKAMGYQLTVAQVYQKIHEILSGEKIATTLSTSTKDYEVVVKMDTNKELTRKDIRKLIFDVTDQAGKTKKVKLSDIAEFQVAESPNSINRDAQSRYMNVSAQIDGNHNIGLVSKEIQKKLKQYSLPAGYTVEMKGEDESIQDAMGQLMQMLILALLFMYLIMVAQFQSLLSPFIVMFTVPLAFTGGFLGLLVAGLDLSVIAMIGFIMLSGIIVNNGIVLVDFINQLRREGMEKHKAIVLAGRTRLRPIIMTALTTILGLSTMAIGMGMGADMVQPMAVVTIGGLIYGTLLTLFFVPCIYDILNQKKDITEENID